MTEPITTNIRAMVTAGWDPWPSAREHILEKCDAIDAVHANLERENESLRRELDRVLGEREEAPTTIGSATVTITPRLDWSAVALELRELAALCERTREVEP